MKLLTILLACLMVSGNLIAQRDVIWQHGLSDSDAFWRNYAAEFEGTRNIRSTNVRFNSENGVRNMANLVAAGTPNGANNIGIGHSMGGVVLREVQNQINPNHVGGIITVGSPLNGARISNTMTNGEFRGYISHGINELTKGPAREVFGISYIILRVGTRAFTGRALQEILLDEVGFDNLILNEFGNASSNDLAENSAYMNQARNYNMNIPRISIFGNENSPVHYRLASTTIGQPDNHFPDIIRQSRGVYNAFYIKNVATFFNIINISKAAGWKAGRDYLDNGSEKGWNNLTGATRVERRQSCFEDWVCGDDYSCFQNIVTYEDYLECEELCYTTICRTITQHYNQPSDGLLHQSTQIGERTHGT
ncbi:MAG: esterase/lipase family protein, partial [Cyclobacteriaceae bacterium]